MCCIENDEDSYIDIQKHKSKIFRNPHEKNIRKTPYVEKTHTEKTSHVEKTHMEKISRIEKLIQRKPYA